MQGSILDCAKSLFSRRVSAVELLNRTVAAQEAAKSLNAFISTCSISDCEESARAVDRLESCRPLLAGMPISIKDNFMVEGYTTTAGSNMLRSFGANFDATLVEKLRQQQALLANKANLDEFGMGSSTANSSFGPTISPWTDDWKSRTEDLSATGLTAGGSSGGSGVAITAGCSAAAIGSDTGGSVRQPASFGGIVGLKPTHGRISRHGLIAYASSLDTPGILARSVTDAALVFDVVEGLDHRDPLSGAYKGFGGASTTEDGKVSVGLLDAPADLSAVTEADVDRMLARGCEPVCLKGKRIGIPEELVVQEIDATIRAAWQQTVCVLEKAGATVVPVSVPSLQYAIPIYYVLACAEVSSNLSRYDGIRYGHRSDMAAVSSNAGTDAGGGVAETVSEDLFAALVSRTRAEGFGLETIKRVLSGTFVLSRDAFAETFNLALTLRGQLKGEFKQVFGMGVDGGDGGVDALLCPTSPVLPYTYDQVPSAADLLANDLMTVPANLAGIPAISIPVANTILPNSNQAVPIGMQLMSPWYQEENLCKIALAVEQRVNYVNPVTPV
mgnify:CR=1 FL=1